MWNDNDVSLLVLIILVLSLSIGATIGRISGRTAGYEAAYIDYKLDKIEEVVQKEHAELWVRLNLLQKNPPGERR